MDTRRYGIRGNVERKEAMENCRETEQEITKLGASERDVLEKGVRFHPKFSGERECFLTVKEKVPVIQFRALEELPFLKHGFSTRLGGVSTGEWSSMNLSYARGDQREAVDANFTRIRKALGMEFGRMVRSDQVHGTQVAYADGKTEVILETDGLMTDQPGVILATSFADCVPLMFADRRKRAVASVHSGWRGTALGMGAVTVDAMRRRFGSRPEDLICVIGPSICQDCYEVSKDLKEAFRARFTKEETERLFCPAETKGKYHLDLWTANRWILEKAGVLPEHIHTAGICTCCNKSLLFSHRATGGRRGNMNGFMMLCGSDIS